MAERSALLLGLVLAMELALLVLALELLEVALVVLLVLLVPALLALPPDLTCVTIFNGLSRPEANLITACRF